MNYGKPFKIIFCQSVSQGRGMWPLQFVSLHDYMKTSKVEFMKLGRAVEYG